ncbi:hypothetical protein Y601_4557 [Burkholderia pseudomallei MSHR640]|nr:hypothetical protein Y601_4557 [Burkholderia pseudomallei MSHR640]
MRGDARRIRDKRRFTGSMRAIEKRVIRLREFRRPDSAGRNRRARCARRTRADDFPHALRHALSVEQGRADRALSRRRRRVDVRRQYVGVQCAAHDGPRRVVDACVRRRDRRQSRSEPVRIVRRGRRGARAARIGREDLDEPARRAAGQAGAPGHGRTRRRRVRGQRLAALGRLLGRSDRLSALRGGLARARRAHGRRAARRRAPDVKQYIASYADCLARAPHASHAAARAACVADALRE